MSTNMIEAAKQLVALREQITEARALLDHDRKAVDVAAHEI